MRACGQGGSASSEAVSNQDDVAWSDIDALVGAIADLATELPIDGGDEEAVFLMFDEAPSAAGDLFVGPVFQPHDAADVVVKFVHFSDGPSVDTGRIVTGKCCRAMKVDEAQCWIWVNWLCRKRVIALPVPERLIDR